jgi:hypothetical protein
MTMVATPISRLFTKPITLVKRVATGEDSYGQPVYREDLTVVKGYYRQMRTGDTDVLAATVVYENIEVFLPADTPAGPYDAVELAIHGLTERMEIVGQPAEEWNARVGQVNHLKMLVRRAAP